MQRYFGVRTDGKITLKDNDLYHIKKVMRMNIADKIEVVVETKTYLCCIDNLDPFALCELEVKEENNELEKIVTIAQGIVKEQKMDLILQKCTELGMSNFLPLNMERCLVKLTDKEEKKLIRWQSICKEASEQSNRNLIPNVLSVKTLKEINDCDYDLKLICSTKEEIKTIKNVLQEYQTCVRILVVIGPEGGISPKEEDYLVDKGFIRISLGKRILRTESAPIFVMSAINYEEMRS